LRHLPKLRAATNSGFSIVLRGCYVTFWTLRVSSKRQNLGLAFQYLEADSQPVTARNVAFICDENAGSAPAFLSRKGARAMQQRQRFTQVVSLEVRLADEAAKLRKQARGTPAGVERDRLLRRARQAETGSHMSEWLRSPGLQPPK
jgi:hypothetical protein